MRHINEKGLVIIKDSESLRLKRYKCPAGYWTIGWGHRDDTLLEINEAQADEFLKEDVEGAEEDVDMLVEVPITDNQFSALVSFVFNIGGTAFSKSTLLRKLNAGDYEGAADEFPKWVYAKGKKLNGLIIRRAKERSLFLEST